MSNDASSPFIIRLLDRKRHNRAEFNSGSDPLDIYLKTRAGQEQRNNVAFPYVLTKDDRILGYYTLSATSVLTNALPQGLSRKIGYELAPAVLIGRLAVDQSQQGEGLGRILLVDALRRIVRSGDFAVTAIVVDPKDEKATYFYAHHGFEPLENEGHRMFISFNKIKNL